MKLINGLSEIVCVFPLDKNLNG